MATDYHTIPCTDTVMIALPTLHGHLALLPALPDDRTATVSCVMSDIRFCQYLPVALGHQSRTE